MLRNFSLELTRRRLFMVLSAMTNILWQYVRSVCIPFIFCSGKRSLSPPPWILVPFRGSTLSPLCQWSRLAYSWTLARNFKVVGICFFHDYLLKIRICCALLMFGFMVAASSREASLTAQFFTCIRARITFYVMKYTKLWNSRWS